MSSTIECKTTWTAILPALLAVLENGTETGKQEVKEELSHMAFLADHAFKPLEITLNPMKADPSEYESALADTWDEVSHFDVLLRPEGADPIAEYENLDYQKALEMVDKLMSDFPQAGFEDLTGLLSGRAPDHI